MRAAAAAAGPAAAPGGREAHNDASAVAVRAARLLDRDAVLSRDARGRVRAPQPRDAWSPTSNVSSGLGWRAVVALTRPVREVMEAALWPELTAAQRVLASEPKAKPCASNINVSQEMARICAV